MVECQPLYDLLKNSGSRNPSDDILQRAAHISQDKVWAGEDAILTAADFLRRPIHVYIAAEQSSPLVYSVCESSLTPILLCFMEPGHYQAVVKQPDAPASHRDMTSPPTHSCHLDDTEPASYPSCDACGPSAASPDSDACSTPLSPSAAAHTVISRNSATLLEPPLSR
jgi:hypothetical protein